MKEKIKNIGTIAISIFTIAITLCLIVGMCFKSGSPEALICCDVLTGLSIAWVVSLLMCFTD